MSIITTKYQVTEEQISKAHRIEDYQKHQVIFKVENSRGDVDAEGNVIEYTVSWDRVHGCLTCTCPAGNPPIVNGFPLYAPRNCWHMRAAVAAAEEYQREQIQ